jgi:hypothetical protein
MAGKSKKKANKKPGAGIPNKKATTNTENVDSTANRKDLLLEQKAVAHEDADSSNKIIDEPVKEADPIGSSEEDVNPENNVANTPVPSPPSSLPQSSTAVMNAHSPIEVNVQQKLQDASSPEKQTISPSKPAATEATISLDTAPSPLSPVVIETPITPSMQVHSGLDLQLLDDDIEDDDESEAARQSPSKSLAHLDSQLNELHPSLRDSPKQTTMSASQAYLNSLLSEFNDSMKDSSKEQSASAAQASFRFASIVPRSADNGVPVSIKVYEEDQEEATRLMQQLDSLKVFLEETWANIRESRSSVQEVRRTRNQHDSNVLEEALRSSDHVSEQHQQPWNEQRASTERSLAEDLVRAEEAELAELVAAQVCASPCRLLSGRENSTRDACTGL